MQRKSSAEFLVSKMSLWVGRVNVCHSAKAPESQQMRLYQEYVVPMAASICDCPCNIEIQI